MPPRLSLSSVATDWSSARRSPCDGSSGVRGHAGNTHLILQRCLSSSLSLSQSSSSSSSPPPPPPPPPLLSSSSLPPPPSSLSSLSSSQSVVVTVDDVVGVGTAEHGKAARIEVPCNGAPCSQSNKQHAAGIIIFVSSFSYTTSVCQAQYATRRPSFRTRAFPGYPCTSCIQATTHPQTTKAAHGHGHEHEHGHGGDRCRRFLILSRPARPTSSASKSSRPCGIEHARIEQVCRHVSTQAANRDSV